jgi:hypothetical protein
VTSTPDADPSRNSVLASDPRQSQPPPNARVSLWRIENADLVGNTTNEDSVLSDASVVQFRGVEGSGYLQLGARKTAVVMSGAEASRFMLYKADVPDPMRPTTCDSQIRDEDFVFARLLAPSMWVSVAASGVLEVEKARRPLGSQSNPSCARQEERCHTDARGGLVCVWAPVHGE